MNDDIRWTYLTHQEIVEKLAEEEIYISPPVVADLLRLHGFKKRRMSQCRTIKDVENRDEQFINIDRLRNIYTQAGEPVVSVDSKKKEPFGSLYRKGKVYSTRSPEVYDHSFASLQTGLSVPHGIFDVNRNKACVNIGLSCDTAEFFCDSTVLWRETYGKIEYPDATKLLILCDGGGSNGCRHYVFKEAVQKLADTLGITVRIAHYPAYCSKYNPIEHRLFPHVTKALSGVILDSVQTVKALIESRANTKKGLETYVNIVDKIYETGKKASELFMENMPVIFDQFLPKWNYKAVPVS